MGIKKCCSSAVNISPHCLLSCRRSSSYSANEENNTALSGGRLAGVGSGHVGDMVDRPSEGLINYPCVFLLGGNL